MMKTFIAKYLPSIYRLVGVAIFSVIVSQLDLKMLFKAAEASNKHLLSVGVLIMVGVTVVKTLRWSRLLKQQNISVKALKLVRIQYIGNFIGFITPGRIGELAKVFYVKGKSHGFDYMGCIVSVIADRIIDIATLSLIAVVGILFIFNEHVVMIMMAILFLVLIIAMSYFYRQAVVDYFVKVINRIIIKFVRNKNKIEASNIVSNLRNIKKTGILNVLFYNVLAWALFYILIYLIARSCNITIDVFYLAVAISSAMLLSMIPITVAGVGIRDLVLIYFFGRVGISSEMAVLYSFMYMFIFLLVPSFIGFAMYLVQRLQS